MKTMFANTILQGVNKAGVLKPDANGYYDVVLGALDVINSAGEKYVLTDVSRNTFSAGSALDKRVSEGLLKGEWGHPKASDYRNPLQFERRIRTIDEDRISHTISKVWLDEIEYDGKRVLGVLGKVKPCGPYGKYLQEMLDDPAQNVCFSGRFYSNLRKNPRTGITEREIHTVGTWDFVSAPGISQAKKYASPSLESEDFNITDCMLEQAYKTERKHVASGDMSLESGVISVTEIMPLETRTKLVSQYQAKQSTFNW